MTGNIIITRIIGNKYKELPKMTLKVHSYVTEISLIKIWHKSTEMIFCCCWRDLTDTRKNYIFQAKEKDQNDNNNFNRTFRTDLRILVWSLSSNSELNGYDLAIATNTIFT